MKNYKYSFTITIEKDIDTISDLIIDDDLMSEWQPDLSKIEYVNDLNNQTGTEKILHFTVQNQTMKMKEHTTLNQLPERLTQIYELGDVWNECDNHFRSHGKNTTWTMDVIFKFGGDPPAPQKAFEEKTHQGMLAFKKFVETYKKSYKD